MEAALERPTVLVIDGDADTRTILEDVLTECGLAVLAAGEQAATTGGRRRSAWLGALER